MENVLKGKSQKRYIENYDKRKFWIWDKGVGVGAKSPYFMPPKQMYVSFTHGIFLSVHWKLAILKDVSIFRSGAI